MHRYLASLSEQLDTDRIRVMQSNGGTLSLSGAQQHAVQTILSGPAGGAVGGFEIAQRAGFANVITFDMGGTSTDVCLSPGRLSQTAEASIGGIPIRVPVIDIHTVGAGGGSIAYRDPGGSLRVGPRSAGAEPGPVCYGRGGVEPTVTDANLMLGRLSASHFLGGAQQLEIGRCRAAIIELASSLRLSPLETAEGILRVANTTMERAIRVISLERGFDPRDFVLVCFGGAGGMHAADLARSLQIPKVLVPRAAGILSALGMLLADFVRDYSQTELRSTDGLDTRELDDAFRRLEKRASREYDAEGVDPAAIVLERSLDMRYVGQGFELAVPMGDGFERTFHDLHRQRYGYANPSRPSEVVNIRVRAVGRTEKPQLPQYELKDRARVSVAGGWRMVFDGTEVNGSVIERTSLTPGSRFAGPALVVEYSTTTVVPPDFSCCVDQWGNLVLEPTSDTR
jgi:N-methylhydantoinase A